MTGARVLFYVQHLLGIGHFRRAITLVDAMTHRGLEVTLVSGGFPVPGMAPQSAKVVQLPPAGAADMSFRQLIFSTGAPVDEAWKQLRRQRVLQAWDAAAPQALVVELFPFGRRQMRFELLPLLDAASRGDRPAVRVSSVRDVLGGGQNDPAKQDQAVETFERHFDHLLVHGDPAVIPFGATFRHAQRIAGRLHYTGYVVDSGVASDGGSSHGGSGDSDGGEVLVSAGGGAVGKRLMQAAVCARRLSELGGRRWRLLAGMNCSETELAELRALALAEAGDGIRVEQHRPDFLQLLASCRVSVSQGGYNTVLETLRAGARCVVVPFAGGAEVEQSLRAGLLAARGWIELVQESDLTPQSLAQAIDSANSRPVCLSVPIDMNGAARSAELIDAWIQERFG